MGDKLHQIWLRICSKFPRPIMRAFSVLKLCWDCYGPQTWLLLYYPLLYLVKSSEQHLSSLCSRYFYYCSFAETGSRGTLLLVAIIGLLFYVLLLRYHLLDNACWFRQNKYKITHGSHEDIPDESLHTDIKTGLRHDEVAARRKIYGANEIWSQRNWIRALLKLFIGPANLLVEVRTL